MAKQKKKRLPKTEQKMLEDGYLREQKAKKRTFLSKHKASKKLVSEAVAATYANLRDNYFVRSYSGEAFHILKRLDVQKLATIGVQVMFDAAGEEWSKTYALSVIGRDIEAYDFADKLRRQMIAQNPQHGLQNFKDLENRAARQGVDIDRRLSYLQYINERKDYVTGINDWTTRLRLLVARPIYNAVLEATEFFHIDTSKHPTKEKYKLGVVKFDPEFAQILEDRYDDFDWRTPDFSPMTSPPNKWGEGLGPYNKTELAVKVPLVRNVKPQQGRLIKDAITDGSMQPVLDAVNFLQEVSYKINPYTLEAIKWCIENEDIQESLKKFPLLKRKPVPKWPEKDEELANWSSKRKVAFGKLRDRIINKNEGVAANTAIMMDDIGEAEGLLHYQFWLPHNLDTRSRVYHVPKFGHHRADFIRSLFLFYYGKVVTEDNVAALLLQIANTWGNEISPFDERKVDKVSLDDRIQWAKDNEDIIMLCGRDEGYKDPKALKHWIAADKPFQHLAACRELYLAQTLETHVCGLPIAFDGSNSGLQHYSAQARNAEDGHKVNLVPDDLPQDIYDAVAQNVTLRVEEDMQAKTAEDREMAILWLNFGITRSVVKRNVMTVPYASTQRGMADQIVEDTMDDLADDEAFHGKPHPFVDEVTARVAANYLAKKNREAVGEIVQSAQDGMDFLKKLERTMRQLGNHMHWTTATGFPAAQHYVETDAEHVEMPLFNTDLWVLQRDIRNPNTGKKSAVRVTHNVDSERISWRDSNNGIAPNFTHSMDATHLMMTVNKCHEYDVKNLMVVHDSFATDISDCQPMNQCIRAAFVELYADTDIYQELLEHCRAQADGAYSKKIHDGHRVPRNQNPNLVNWPTPPKPKNEGDNHWLNLMLVMNSEYAFS